MPDTPISWSPVAASPEAWPRRPVEGEVWRRGPRGVVLEQGGFLELEDGGALALEEGGV